MAALCGALVCPPAVPVLANAPKTDPYLLSAGDRITVTVAGQADLSGNMPVDGAGNINLPFLGPVQVENLTVEQCSKLIRDRLASGYLIQPQVSVRLTEPRPLYIVGDVRTPGTYPFRYGSTVASVVAAAGGFALTEPVRSLEVSDYLSAEGQLRQLVFEQTALQIRRLRLQAQVDGRDSFSVPNTLAAHAKDDISGVVASEKATLASQAALLKAEMQILQSLKPRLEGEIGATSEEIRAERSRLDLVRAEIGRSGRLLKQGLGTRSPEIQLKLEEATEESNIWRLQAEMSRLQREVGELELKIEEGRVMVRKQAIAELATVGSRLAELAVVIPSARAMRDWKLQLTGETTDRPSPYVVSITRTRAGQVTVVTANETAPVEPGDVVDIKRAVPGSALSRQTAQR